MGSHLSIARAKRHRRNTYKTMNHPHNQHQNIPKSAHPNDHVTTQNLVRSRLHALPAELLIEIDRHLTDDDISSSRYSAAAPKMAIRATCRRFRAILPSPPAPGYCWSSWDRRAYHHLLKLAEFRKLCASERGGRLTGTAGSVEDADNEERMVCCICRRSHLRECFTPAEQKKEPEKRLYIGSQGVLQICPHNRVTFAGLRINPTGMKCKHAHYTWNSYNSSVVVREVKQHGIKEAKVEVSLDLGEVDAVLNKTFLQHLMRVNWRVCPHLHTADAFLWFPGWLPALSRICMTAGCHPNDGLSHHYKQWLRVFKRNHIDAWPAFRCGAKYCDTRIALEKEQRTYFGRTRSYLMFKVERYLGDISEGADGKKWVAQIVEASHLDDDRFLLQPGQQKSRYGILKKIDNRDPWVTRVCRVVRSPFPNRRKETPHHDIV